MANKIRVLSGQQCCGWKNKNGTGYRSRPYPTWKEYWEEISGRSFPTTCRGYGCSNEATVGAHIIHSGRISGEWIVPFCQECNKQTEPFDLNERTIVVSANTYIIL